MIPRILILPPRIPHMIQIILILLLDQPPFHKLSKLLSILPLLHLIRFLSNILIIFTIELLLMQLFIIFVVKLIIELLFELFLFFDIEDFLHLFHALEL